MSEMRQGDEQCTSAKRQPAAAADRSVEDEALGPHAAEGADVGDGVCAGVEWRAVLVEESREAREDAEDDARLFRRVPRVKQHSKLARCGGHEYVDSAGRRVDVHALRHTFWTMLGRAGVPLRSAMELMRHTDPKPTTRTYPHLRVHDVTGAFEQLPAFPKTNLQANESTGTFGARRTQSATSSSAETGSAPAGTGGNAGALNRGFSQRITVCGRPKR